MTDPDLKLQQKRGLKTSRIPIKVVQSEPLRKPEWIRVRAGGGERFTEIKKILREANLHTWPGAFSAILEGLYTGWLRAEGAGLALSAKSVGLPESGRVDLNFSALAA